jgi:hypothetical protein
MKGYTRTYVTGRLAAQVLLTESPGWLVRLLPTLDIAIQNTWAHLAVEISWLFGSVTLGYMTRGWVERVREEDTKRWL